MESLCATTVVLLSTQSRSYLLGNQRWCPVGLVFPMSPKKNIMIIGFKAIVLVSSYMLTNILKCIIHFTRFDSSSHAMDDTILHACADLSQKHACKINLLVRLGGK